MIKLPQLKLPKKHYSFKDYHQTTLDYIDYVTNPKNIYDAENNEINGYIEHRRVRKIARFLPSKNIDEYFKSSGNLAFGLPAYIGSKQEDDCVGEAINILALVLSGILNGLDMENYKGFNYLKSCVHFFDVKHNIITNTDYKRDSLWYLFYSAVLFTNIALSSHKDYLDEIVILSALTTMKMAESVNFNFEFVSFDFDSFMPIYNNTRTEEEGLVGAAYVMYGAYLIGTKRSLDPVTLKSLKESSIKCIDKYYSYNKSPQYEILSYIAPYLACVFNEKFKTSYNIDKLIHFTLNGKNRVRVGWGMIQTLYYSRYTVGLLGSITDGSGYPFTMNTFAYSMGIIPLLQYTKDPHIINFVARWALASSVSARLFYPEAHSFVKTLVSYGKTKVVSGIQQSGVWIDQHSPKASFIAYEGLRKNRRIPYYFNNQRKTKFYQYGPYASGDAYTFNWYGHTDYGLYGSSHVGLFGAIYKSSGINGIIKTKLNTLDFLNPSSENNILIFNPHKYTIDYEGVLIKSKEAIIMKEN